MNGQMMPIFASMASTRVQNVVTRKLEQTINDYIVGQNVTYQDMVTLEKDESGTITALTSNMSRLNGMRNGIFIEVSKAVETVDTQELSLPAGNLTGLSFLSGRGFRLPVRIVSVGSARAEFSQSFSAAGINQTHHQIMLRVTVTVDILLPGETVTTQVNTEVCAAETVIVGSVPQTYLQLNP
ncbi:Sporulation protein YunB [bioreactor metagenome]|uniref:Sporulation protein YunB n=1 Tax=bioreactor metagenome TaxID=1076179 RepID=A0A645ECK6_9ZZZZ